MKTGIELITEERARQISREGWTALHDAVHTRGELSKAAACYATCAAGQVQYGFATMAQTPPLAGWPWERDWWKPADDPIRTLTKAGALIAAEIDRLQLHRQHVAAIELKPSRGLADG